MARHKVEITGINTAELVPISNEETMELLVLAHEGNDEARDQLVYGNLKIVLSVAIIILIILTLPIICKFIINLGFYLGKFLRNLYVFFEK